MVESIDGEHTLIPTKRLNALKTEVKELTDKLAAADKHIKWLVEENEGLEEQVEYLIISRDHLSRLMLQQRMNFENAQLTIQRDAWNEGFNKAETMDINLVNPYQAKLDAQQSGETNDAE